MSLIRKFLFKNKKHINGLIHVGANVGQEVPMYLEITNSNIYLFEPLDSAFEILKDKYGNLQNVKLYNFGLGNKNQEININVTQSNFGSSSSVLKPTGHKKYFPEINFETVESIKIKKYTDVPDIYANFLLIDVQGYELEVIKGFEDKLKNFKFIITEISRKEIYENGVLIYDLDKYLNSEGFLRIKTSWVSNKPTGDAVYINKKDLNPPLIFIYHLKSKFTLSKIYLFLNLFKNRKKLIFVIKEQIKNLWLKNML